MVTAPPPPPDDPSASESPGDLERIDKLLEGAVRLEKMLERLELTVRQLVGSGALPGVPAAPPDPHAHQRARIRRALEELARGREPDTVPRVLAELSELLRSGGDFPGRLLVRAAAESLAQLEEVEAVPLAVRYLQEARTT